MKRGRLALRGPGSGAPRDKLMGHGVTSALELFALF